MHCPNGNEHSPTKINPGGQSYEGTLRAGVHKKNKERYIVCKKKFYIYIYIIFIIIDIFPLNFVSFYLLDNLKTITSS